MAVTTAQLIDRKECLLGGGPVSASATLYEGTFCFEDADGYLEDDTASGVNSFAGVVKKTADNSSGSDGAINVDFYKNGQFLLTGSGFAQTDVGQPVYASDNYTITKTRAAAAVYAGKIVEYVSATQVRVEIDTGKPQAAGAIADPSGGATTDAEARTAINSIIDVLEEFGLIITT